MARIPSRSLPLSICPSQERREARRSPRYLELYIVADHTLVRGDLRGLTGLGWSPLGPLLTQGFLPSQFLLQHQNLNHTRQRLLEVANCVDQVGWSGRGRLGGEAIGERWPRAPAGLSLRFSGLWIFSWC